MGMAVFFVTNQCPSSMGALLQAWSRDCWDLLWSTDSGDQRARCLAVALRQRENAKSSRGRGQGTNSRDPLW